ncbi:MAG: hypothetical protein AAF696_04295 [Bacteroidota bacterium]
MKSSLFLFLICLAFLACEQRITFEPEPEPVNGPISWGKPKVGQKSVYRFFEALYDKEQGLDTVVYARDTMWLEIIGKAGNVYQVEASYTITPITEIYQFSYNNNSLIWEESPANLGTQRLMPVDDLPIMFPLAAIVTPQLPDNHQLFFESNCNENPCTAVKIDHSQMGKDYSQINVLGDYATRDLLSVGMYFFYNQGEGFVRVSYKSPFFPIEFGYDLIPKE